MTVLTAPKISAKLSVTVIVVTLDRPTSLRRCLDCLTVQTLPPAQIIVVDASASDLSKQVVQEYQNRHIDQTGCQNLGDTLYLRNEAGSGSLTLSRNIGLRSATGEIVAFVDDDAYTDAYWLENLILPYADAAVGAVGGRALNNQPGEESTGVTEIGRLYSDGILTGNFAADPGMVIETDHIIGCNMSFRRSLLASLGDFRCDYPGTEVREETDLCLRIRKTGMKIVFQPTAIVTHIAAPQAVGKRFNTRYTYYHERNHLQLLVRHFGLFASIVWRYLFRSVMANTREFLHRLISCFAQLFGVIVGTLVGLAAGFRMNLQERNRPGQTAHAVDCSLNVSEEACHGNENTLSTLLKDRR